MLPLHSEGQTTVASLTSQSPVNVARSTVGVPADLLAAVNETFARTSNPIASGLLREANNIRTFLDSTDIPWDLNNVTKDSGRQVLEAINAKSQTLWMALARLVESDDAGTYDPMIIEALSLLAFDPDAPTGVSTYFGTGIRLYALAMSLYIVFIWGLWKKRMKLLKTVCGLTLSPRSYHQDALPLGVALFYARRAAEVFQTARDEYPAARWCDAVGSYIERWIGANLFATTPTLDRESHYFFYAGEFTLSLLGALAPTIRRPAAGAFYFNFDSTPIITRYLKTEANTLRDLFGDQLRSLLETFDQWAAQIAVSGNCWGDGFQGGSVRLVFPESQAVGQAGRAT